MKGFNVNDKYWSWTAHIMGGLKDVETRNTPSLRSLVGQRVAIIQTGCGQAHIVGFCDVAEEIHYTDIPSFWADYDRHRVELGWFRIGVKEASWTGEKYGYVLKNIEQVEPIPVPKHIRGNVIRNIPTELVGGYTA